MTISLYCAANFVRDGLLSLGLVHPDGRWFYTESTDVSLQESEEHARLNWLPRMKKVPGTYFAPKADVADGIAMYFDQVLEAGVTSLNIVIYNLPAIAEVMDVLSIAASKCRHPLELQFVVAQVDQAHLEDLLDHCGGAQRVSGHALINSMAAALCDDSQRTEFFRRPIHRLEMLMGSKNALSFRAWVRERERSLHERSLVDAGAAGAAA